MQGFSCDLSNCSPIYYNKYCGLIIQFNVKLTRFYHNLLEDKRRNGLHTFFYC